MPVCREPVGADELDDGFADGGLEDTVALIGKFGLCLLDRLAGSGAVDREEVRNAGLVVLVKADGGLAVGHGALELAHDIFGLVHEEDAAVGVGLGHFVLGIAEAHDARAHLGDERLGELEGIGEGIVEARADVAAELDMLALILADGDEVGLVEQDIGGHEHGIGKQARGDIICMLLRFHFELRHARQLAELRIAAQHPRKLRMLRHVGLDEHDVLLRIEAAGDILRELLQTSAAQIGRNLPDGNGVHIDDTIDALIFVLQCDPVFDRPHIRAERQIAAGLDAGKDAFFFVHDTSFFLFDRCAYHTTNRRNAQSMIDCF